MNEQANRPGREDEDEAFDALLRAHVAAELNPQTGRTAEAFRQRAHAAELTTMHRWRIGRRVFAAAAALMIGLGVSFWTWRLDGPRSPMVGASQPAPTQPTRSTGPMEAIVTRWTETIDGGTVMLDPQTPARMYRRVDYQKTDWRDDAGRWQSKVTVPNQDVIFIDLPKQ